jgi:predicted RNA-binding Zn-ribbon protein involved in translation (DUF1610 family)
MKFLCVECDEAMKLKETLGPENGSMTVLFRCPKCGKDIAMLTNQMETQMVRSLDVKIGGRSVPAEPMEKIRSSLAYQKEDTEITENQVVEEELEDSSSASKCPFTGMVEQAYESDSTLSWTDEAKERMDRIPSFVRSMVQKRIEQYALENSVNEINVTVLEEVREKMGM